MSEQSNVVEIKLSDIVEVQTFPQYGVITLVSGKMTTVTLSAAQQVMQMIGDERLINVTVKYGNGRHGETLH